jgi:GAF domain-containing protein
VTTDTADAFAVVRALLTRALPRSDKARLLAEALRAARGYHWVGLYDVTADEIRAIGWSGELAPAFPVFPRAQGLNGAAVASGLPLIVQDVSQDPRWLTTFGSSQAEAIFPVLVGGAAVGTIDVESERVGVFNQDDELFLARAAEVLRPLWLRTV